MPGPVQPCTVTNIHILTPQTDTRSHASKRKKVSGQWLGFPWHPGMSLQNNIYLSGDAVLEQLGPATVPRWIRVKLRRICGTPATSSCSQTRSCWMSPLTFIRWDKKFKVCSNPAGNTSGHYCSFKLQQPHGWNEDVEHRVLKPGCVWHNKETLLLVSFLESDRTHAGTECTSWLTVCLRKLRHNTLTRC